MVLVKYFHIPTYAPYSENTFQFQKCIQRHVGRVTFHTRPDRSRLFIVDTESQAEAILTLKDHDWKPFPVSSDTQLNTRTGTVLIPPEIYPVSINWPACSSDLLELIADEHKIAHVSCLLLTLMPSKYCKNYIQMTRSSRQFIHK